MSAPVSWIAAGAASIAFHAGIAGFLGLSIDPQPVDPQPKPKSRIEFAAFPVKRETLEESSPESLSATEAEAKSTGIASGAIPSTNTAGLAPDYNRLQPSLADPENIGPASAKPDIAQSIEASEKLDAVTATSTVTATANPEASPVEAISQDELADDLGTVSKFGERVTDVAPSQNPVAPAVANDTRIEPVFQAMTIVEAAAAPEAVSIVAGNPEGVTTSARKPPANAASALRLESAASPDLSVAGDPASETNVETTFAPSAPIESQHQTASLAWSGSDLDRIDPLSIAAIQSFMNEGDITAADDNVGAVRDGIEGLFASVPCARLQVEFLPETGELELRGHVPEAGLRQPIQEAIQARIGTSIPVTENLLILPRPQCGALAGIAGVGLPQSTDQRTNPRLVGPDTHARLYAFSGGQRLIFDLVAPDYDAYIYVDYFDAAGNVIHLVPNDRVTTERQIAKSAVQIGADRPDGNFLAVTIGAPFGQEIAVAFAASEPLYDGVRPVVEPAEPYLDWLRSQISNARARSPSFKGEWVYFFVRTSAD